MSRSSLSPVKSAQAHECPSCGFGFERTVAGKCPSCRVALRASTPTRRGGMGKVVFVVDDRPATKSTPKPLVPQQEDLGVCLTQPDDNPQVYCRDDEVYHVIYEGLFSGLGKQYCPRCGRYSHTNIVLEMPAKQELAPCHKCKAQTYMIYRR